MSLAHRLLYIALGLSGLLALLAFYFSHQLPPLSHTLLKLSYSQLAIAAVILGGQLLLPREPSPPQDPS